LSYDIKVINGDLVLQGGDFRLVYDSEKLIQSILKICLTPAGSNPLQPWFGSFINRSLIGSSLSSSITVQIAQSQLQNALQNLMTLQQQQVKSFQQVSPDELLNSISGISITRSSSNPTLYNVVVSVMNKGFKPITTAFTVSTI
jgi:phage baseplate assembly protein W